MIYKFEESAGGIIFKKESNHLYILVTQHSGHHGWIFPKGWIDKGEDVETTALREVREEGGVEAKILEELPSVEYFYQNAGNKVKKKVTYFLMEYVSGDIVDHDWEVEDSEWVPIEKVDKKLSFKSDRQVFQKAKNLMKR